MSENFLEKISKKKLKRRSFLKWSGAAAVPAIIGGAGISRNLIRDASAAEKAGKPIKEEIIPTASVFDCGGKSNIQEELATNKFVFLSPRDRTKATVTKVACMGRIVKPKVESIIGSKLSKENVIVTDAWRAYKSFAKARGLRALPY